MIENKKKLNNDKKKIALLGSTGSIGSQALEVIKLHFEYFQVEVLTAQNNAQLLIQQAKIFKPNCVVITNESYYHQVDEALTPLDIKVFTGVKALEQVVEMDSIDIVLVALVGYSGLMPTVNAIKNKKNIALANKETLVVAGELITQLAEEYEVSILPVDSEHSAIFQCLEGEFYNPIEKIILTASGGPFRGFSKNQLQKVTKEQALKHPNWEMGSKITIDSATMINKGLEIIESKWLFDVDFQQIEVLVHPQSIVHSMVQFKDGSIKAQLGLSDMRIPIQYALSYPRRLESNFSRINFSDYSQLTFEEPDFETFVNLQLSIDAGKKGGNAPCVLNAANEVAVQSFLEDRINFIQISDVIEKCLEKLCYICRPVLDDLIETDRETRIKAKEIIK